MNATPVPPSGKKILPVVFGYDIAAYSFARIFHEAIGVRSLVVAEAARGPINDSRILGVRLVPEGTCEDESAFLATLDSIAREHADERLVLLVNTDEAVEFAAKNRSRLQRDWFLPYGSQAAVETANSKAAMAGIVTAIGLSAPARTRIDLEDPDAWKRELKGVRFPVVVKPERGSDLGAYWNQGLRKVLPIPTRPQAYETFERWRRGGVRAPLIVQELIPGDDTVQWVVNGYVDSRGEVTLIGSARVLLEDHAPTMIGNPVAMITEDFPQLWADACALLTENGYRGFANFDVKIDPRDGRALFFEVNPRIGRNNWYMAAAGANPMIPMVADLIDGQACEQTQATDEILYTLVPDSLLLRYITDSDLRGRVKRIIREGRRFDLLLNPTEKDLRRNLIVWLQKQNHRRKFARYYPEPTETSY